MIIVQRNTLEYPVGTFRRIRSQNMKVGLGLNPDDDVNEASHFFKGLDLLLLLGVFPGFGGQSMQPDTLERIAFARHLTNQLDHRIIIAVDGGVKPENTASLVQAGADILIMGTALFHSSDMAKTMLDQESIMGTVVHTQSRMTCGRFMCSVPRPVQPSKITLISDRNNIMHCEFNTP
jgi:ribulose-phosphate 3-epimerase